MKTDFTSVNLDPEGHTAKQQTRRMALNILRDHSGLLWSRQSQHLRCDWMELAGRRAPTLRMLIDENAFAPYSVFQGVDLDANVIEDCKAYYANSEGNIGMEWHNCRIESLVSKPDSFRSTGVLVYDSEEGAWRERWDRLKCITEFAKRQAEFLGEFLLVVNVVGDTRWTTPSAVKKYVEHLSEQTGVEISEKCLHRYRSSTATMLWTAVRFGF